MQHQSILFSDYLRKENLATGFKCENNISCLSWYHIQMPEGEGYLSRTFRWMNKWKAPAVLSHTWGKVKGHQHRKSLSVLETAVYYVMWSFLNWGLIIILWRGLASHTNTGQARLVSNWPWKDLMISMQEKCLMKSYVGVYLSHSYNYAKLRFKSLRIWTRSSKLAWQLIIRWQEWKIRPS